MQDNGMLYLREKQAHQKTKGDQAVADKGKVNKYKLLLLQLKSQSWI